MNSPAQDTRPCVGWKIQRCLQVATWICIIYWWVYGGGDWWAEWCCDFSICLRRFLWAWTREAAVGFDRFESQTTDNSPANKKQQRLSFNKVPGTFLVSEIDLGHVFYQWKQSITVENKTVYKQDELKTKAQLRHQDISAGAPVKTQLLIHFFHSRQLNSGGHDTTHGR